MRALVRIGAAALAIAAMLLPTTALATSQMVTTPSQVKTNLPDVEDEAEPDPALDPAERERLDSDLARYDL